ncbi:hypothetical protein D9M68_174270 [compost metagenome]
MIFGKALSPSIQALRVLVVIPKLQCDKSLDRVRILVPTNSSRQLDPGSPCVTHPFANLRLQEKLRKCTAKDAGSDADAN